MRAGFFCGGSLAEQGTELCWCSSRSDVTPCRLEQVCFIANGGHGGWWCCLEPLRSQLVSSRGQRCGQGSVLVFPNCSWSSARPCRQWQDGEASEASSQHLEGLRGPLLPPQRQGALEGHRDVPTSADAGHRPGGELGMMQALGGWNTCRGATDMERRLATASSVKGPTCSACCDVLWTLS